MDINCIELKPEMNHQHTEKIKYSAIHNKSCPYVCVLTIDQPWNQLYSLYVINLLCNRETPAYVLSFKPLSTYCRFSFFKREDPPSFGGP